WPARRLRRRRSAMARLDDRLAEKLDAVRARLRRQTAAQTAAAASAAAGLGFALLRLAFLAAGNPSWAMPLAGGALAAIAWVRLTPPASIDRLAAARMVDRALSLGGETGTAVEYSGDASSPFTGKLLASAARQAGRLHPPQILPWRFSRTYAWAAFSLAAAVAAALANPVQTSSSPPAAVEEAAADLYPEELKALAEQLLEEASHDPLRQQLARELEELARSIEEGLVNREEAGRALERIEALLRTASAPPSAGQDRPAGQAARTMQVPVAQPAAPNDAAPPTGAQLPGEGYYTEAPFSPDALERLQDRLPEGADTSSRGAGRDDGGDSGEGEDGSPPGEGGADHSDEVSGDGPGEEEGGSGAPSPEAPGSAGNEDSTDGESAAWAPGAGSGPPPEGGRPSDGD